MIQPNDAGTARLCSIFKLLTVSLIAVDIFSSVAHSYDDGITHPTFSEIAVFQSRLFTDPSLLRSIGLKPLGENLFELEDGDEDEENDMPPSSIIDLIKLGSVSEDSGTKSTRHFYDPQNERGLTWISREFIASPDWILNDDSTIASAPEHTYRAARYSYINALTHPDPDDREDAYAQVFKSLGHVLHHIQDMGQPQHVRNDIHCNIEFCKQLRDETGADLYRPSLYEAHTKSPRQQQGILSGAIPTTGYLYQAPVFKEPRHYWVNSNFPGTGMAEFVSTYFLTENNHLLYNPAQDRLQSDASQFPLPNAADWNIVTAPCDYHGALGKKEGLLCDYVQGTVLDPLTGFQSTYIVAKKSIAFHWLVKIAVRNGTDDTFLPQLFVHDPIVFDSMYPILLPRITAFSAGMIDYFFRGSLDLEFDSDGTHWSIRNTGDEVLDGRFQLFSDDANGTRTRILTDGWGGRLLTLGPGQSSAPIPFNRPADNNGDFMLVFTGQQGFEGAVGKNDLTSVIGSKKTLPTVRITLGDNGPYLDDRFTLQVWKDSEGGDIYELEQQVPARETVIEFVATPGDDYFIQIWHTPEAPDPDVGGTYAISFSSNIHINENQLGGLPPDPLTGTIEYYCGCTPAWKVTVLDQ